MRIGALVALLVGGYFLWQGLFPGDETRIRRQLKELAEAASFTATEAPLAKLTNAARVANFFTVDGTVEVEPWGYRRLVLSGRDELRQAAVGARNAVAALVVRFENVAVTLTPDRSRATVRLTLLGRTSEQTEMQSQEMRFEMIRTDGDWLIGRAETVEYLHP